MEKIKLENVTLVCVTSVNVERAINALKYSCRGIDFKEVKLLTDKDISDSKIIVEKIIPLDLNGYSKFIVYDLYKHINTEFALIIQDDGFVINPDKWEDEFLKYDYIGAPWALPSDNFSYRDPFGNLIRVGNGGFSLRSKKLLSLSTELELEWKSYFGFYNEDGFFTCHNRHLFEKEGCKYAPLEVAVRFSKEREIEENKGIITFGFHGKYSKNYFLI
jgi:hypothetical protein